MHEPRPPSQHAAVVSGLRRESVAGVPGRPGPVAGARRVRRAPSLHGVCAHGHATLGPASGERDGGRHMSRGRWWNRDGHNTTSARFTREEFMRWLALLEAALDQPRPTRALV